MRCIFLCSCHCLYKSFWKGFESDQRSLLNNIAGYQMRLLLWSVVNKQDAQVSSHVSNIVVLTINSRSPWEMISGFNLTVTRGEKRLFSLLMAVGGKLVVNNITNVRRNLSVFIFTTRQTRVKNLHRIPWISMENSPWNSMED